jgi:ABC-2 type transport system permease protein
MILDAIDRIRTLVIKELQSLVSEPEGRMLLFMPVLIQVAIFPFAATLEVKNATLAVLNQDQGAVSRELIHRFAAAEAFSHVIALESQEQLTRCVERQEANIVVQIPADFSRNLASNAPAQLQVILDGRRSNSSQVAMSYLQEIVQTFFI